jgi:hypothetical protein
MGLKPLWGKTLPGETVGYFAHPLVLSDTFNSLGVSLDTPSSFAGKLRGTGRSEIFLELSKIFRPPRRTICEFPEVPFIVRLLDFIHLIILFSTEH